MNPVQTSKSPNLSQSTPLPEVLRCHSGLAEEPGMENDSKRRAKSREFPNGGGEV